MPLETKDITEYLGIEADSIDDFRVKYEKAYIKRDLIAEDQALMGSIVGRITGATETELRKAMKSAGLEVGDGEYKGGKIEKNVGEAIKKVAEHYSTKIKELESQAGTGNDEKITNLTNLLEKEKKARLDLQGLVDQSKSQYEQEKSTWEKKIKDTKLQFQLGKELENIKWKSGITEIEKRGFHAIIGEKYKIDFDDKDKLVPFTIDGHRIANPKKNGEFKDLSTILEEEGKAANIWEGNPNVKDRVPPRQYMPAQTSMNQGIQNPVLGGRQRVVSERAMANEGKS